MCIRDSCVTGYVHPDKILKNVGAQPGDLLVITKPLGTGVLTTGAKADLVSKEDYDAMTCSMATLNARAAEAAQTFPDVHACTDITGFGLLGHAYEMAEGSDSTLKLFSKKLPLLHGARELAEMGIIPAGAYRNMDYVKPHLRIMDSAEQCLVDLIADPQTSGGLSLIHISLWARRARSSRSSLYGSAAGRKNCSVSVLDSAS